MKKKKRIKEYKARNTFILFCLELAIRFLLISEIFLLYPTNTRKVEISDTHEVIGTFRYASILDWF